MRNIFLFIRRYFTFFAFLFLQGIALWFLFSYNRFHRAKFLGVANELTGRLNSIYNKGEDYFTLNEENKRLHRYNDSLLNLLPQSYQRRDTSLTYSSDSIPFDTLGNYKRYLLRPATVVYNSINTQKNYIQINRGSKHGIKDNMAVISSDGNVVGVVVGVSPNFSQVMSMLHVQNSISASMKRSGDFGTVEWDGKDPQYVWLKRMPKTIEIKKGDTVLTSRVSFNFPPGYMIGTIAEVRIDNATGMYLLKVKTSANFYNLQQVHVVENVEREEQVRLFEETKKRIDESKKTSR